MRRELLLRPLGDQGSYVVKDPHTGAYYTVGEEEHFLLARLDGSRTIEAIRRDFEQHFAESLSAEDFDGFLEMARAEGFLQPDDAASTPDPVEETAPPNRRGPGAASTAEPVATAPSQPAAARTRQSILYWRFRLFDPDRLLTWMEPKLRFCWTRGFLLLSAACILIAGGLVWTMRQEVVTSFAYAWRWETLFLAWLTLAAVTTCHEFAHGLTCKHHGGEVHEIGFLLMYFMPCFYCNVSDAWLFREKSKRLWVTLAGGYLDLFLWALAVFVWRLTVQDSLLNYLGWIVAAITGARTFFNFNPLIKLDGYYLLSDLLEIPNLRQRSLNRLFAHVRWLLWGAPRPERERRGKLLFAFGVASWVFSVMLLSLMAFWLARLAEVYAGTVGFCGGLLLGLLVMRPLFHGLSRGEVAQMIFRRHIRTFLWLAVLGGGVAALILVEVDEWSSGPFTLRPAVREEVRAPVAGFLQTVYVDEGDRVSPGDVLARLEIPDLDSRLDQKRAEIREAQAQLELLKIGARPEEIAEQRARVERAVRWHQLARHDLERMQATFTAELSALDEQIAQARTEYDAATADHRRMQSLFETQVATREQLERTERSVRLTGARLAQALAGKRALQAKGTILAEEELARRDKELANERGALSLLEAGSRAEDVTAQQARLDRLLIELRHLEQLQAKLEIHSRVAGVVVTPRLREITGQYLQEGDPVCAIENLAELEAEVQLPEENLERVRTGQRVRLKLRALPFETFAACVVRIAPAAVAETETTVQSTVPVCCRLEHSALVLRSSMSGHARISTGRRTIGAIVRDWGLRLLRTEFWW